MPTKCDIAGSIHIIWIWFGEMLENRSIFAMLYYHSDALYWQIWQIYRAECGEWQLTNQHEKTSHKFYRLSKLAITIAIESLAGSLLEPSGDYHGAAILEYGMSPTGKVRIIACITLCKMNLNNKQPG